AVVLLAGREQDDALLVLLGGAEAVDARDRRDDDHVAAREQRGRGGVAQAVDVVVPRAVLLDVEIRLRDVGLGLVVVVVGDEVLDRIVWEYLAQLVAELSGERLVVRDQERRALHLLDDPGHRRRLAGAGRAEQRLVALAGLDARAQLGGRPALGARGPDARAQLGDRAGMVAGGPVGLRGFEVGHLLKGSGVTSVQERPPYEAYAAIAASFAGLRPSAGLDG